MQIRFDPGPEYLLVVLEGPWDAAQARVGLDGIVALSKEHGAARVLIDGRGVSSLIPISDRYDLASALATIGGRLRIAVVVAPESMFTKTFEDTATNRGMSLRTTASMDEALEFLKG